MHTWNEISDILVKYLELFPAESERQFNIAAWLARGRADDLFARNNFDGHITTSAFIVDAEAGEMLLLEHKSLGKWLQPGGHTEGDSSLVASALREAVEETGIPPEHLHYRPISEHADLPVDIDSHYIPDNEKKREPGHYHHDFRYIFLYSGSRDNTFNTEESTGMKWLSFEKLQSEPVFSNVAAKVSGVLNLTL